MRLKSGLKFFGSLNLHFQLWSSIFRKNTYFQWFLIIFTFHSSRPPESSKSQNASRCGGSAWTRSDRSVPAVPLTKHFGDFHLRLCIIRAVRCFFTYGATFSPISGTYYRTAVALRLLMKHIVRLRRYSFWDLKFFSKFWESASSCGAVKNLISEKSIKNANVLKTNGKSNEFSWFPSSSSPRS